MSLLSLKPKFWDSPPFDTSEKRGFKHLYDFRDIWKEAVLIMTLASLMPVLVLAILDYNVTQKAIESENLLRTARLVSNTRRRVSYFLEERKYLLDFINRDNTFESLNSGRLDSILDNLNQGVGGFSDLSVIDAMGNERAYSGPYVQKGKNYKDQEWFQNVSERGVYVSEVFLGYRNAPHLVVAVRHGQPDGNFYVLRATIDMDRFNELLLSLEISGEGDAFIINRQGILQTSSREHGNVLEPSGFHAPVYSEKTEVFEDRCPVHGKPSIIGYAYIMDTPFILMVVKQTEKLMSSFHRNRVEIVGFLIMSVVIIVLVILGVSTYLVNQIYIADQKRIAALTEVAHASKMASIGRLAAGVAHEVNNPLAIINEKAGLIKDLFTFKAEYRNDPRLMAIADSILSSVERCGTITRRLLAFSRQTEVTVQPLNLENLIREVLGFLSKEAEYRCIQVTVNMAGDMPEIESDKGKLQQIFLNLINNAFAALKDGGQLTITGHRKGRDLITVQVEDNGCGIAKSDLERIFEPFFTTKAKTGGTGLGLSITYNLVHELGGTIDVASEVDKGTTFTLTMPLKLKSKEVKYESIAGG